MDKGTTACNMLWETNTLQRLASLCFLKYTYIHSIYFYVCKAKAHALPPLSDLRTVGFSLSPIN